MRQLIAAGKSRTALENAKEFHKAEHTPASEFLLLDAYTARVQSLIDQGLRPEAKALLDLVRERFPSARERFDGLVAAACASGGELDGLLQPLNDSQLGADRRASIEQIIQTQVLDLAKLADCATLPPEHGLRQAARALDAAFNLATSGEVTDEQIALPEVSHRSPLAPWKALVRSIACLYRGDDRSCQDYLAAIKTESVPSRLIPAVQTMLGVKPSRALKPAEEALVSATSVNLSALHRTLASLDLAFAKESNPSLIFKEVRAAVRECQRVAPDRLARLKQLIFVRGCVAGLETERLTAALEGGVRQDATFFRMFACEMERSGEPEDLLQAAELWSEFHEHAVREGWFRDGGLETAALYLHVAESLGQLPQEMVEESRSSSGRGGTPRGVRIFHFPGQLYERACSMDPHPEAFAQWMRWAERQPDRESEHAAREWRRIRRDDLDPILHLMERAENRNAIPTALSLLADAEKIDAVHSKVRSARLRLVVASAMNHLRQNKPHLAARRLVEFEALPQSQQGNRRAFVPALHHLFALGSGDKSKAAQTLVEVEGLLEDMLAAKLLLYGIASTSKGSNPVALPRTTALSRRDMASIPKSLASVMAIAEDLGIRKFKLPVAYFDAAEEHFPSVSNTLEIRSLRLLGELGMSTDHPKLAWAVSGVGLKRGGPDEAYFLLLRSNAMPRMSDRYLVVAAAAAELARFHRQPDIVDRAVRITRTTFGDPISLTLDQAREVIGKELASPGYPSRYSREPNYSALFSAEPCNCPDCRRARGEATDDPFDDEAPFDVELDDVQMKKIFDQNLPPYIPPELAGDLFELVRDSFSSGESPDEILSRLLGGRGKKRKGRKKP